MFLLGDSTCAPKDAGKRPETGWGMSFSRLVNEGWEVVNLARNGYSTKSFLDDGLFDLCLKDLAPGDWVLIQFGHNDSKPDGERHTEPWDGYVTNLGFMVEHVRSRQAHVVLLTPICRRLFKDGHLVQTHGSYPEAMLSLRSKLNVPVLDLTSETFRLLSELGCEGSRRLFLQLKPGQSPNYPGGIEDNTHLNEWGAEVVARLVVSFLNKLPDTPPFVIRTA